jgi:hypothetical protein
VDQVLLEDPKFLFYLLKHNNNHLDSLEINK